jgi:CelD/BcsL family acetyltransferase involved in cellulose biosynthesis
VTSDASSALRVRLWSAEEFASSRSAWDDLLARSDADPLFMSWDWQWHWWKHHAPVLNPTLAIVAIYAGDQLAGLAPFQLRKVTVRRLLRARRLELIGIAWRTPRAMFSDYLDIIADRALRDAVVAALDEWLVAQEFWDELALCCTKEGSVAAQLASERLPRYTYVREVDPASGWCAQLPASFEDYVRSLAPEVRRKLFNQRRKLAEPRMEYASESDLAPTLQLLWRFSAARWGGKPTQPHIQSFYEDMAAVLARTQELKLSRLVIAGEPRSVLYNVQRGDRVYYLQSAFDADAARGLSLGYLHFGYAIQAACNEHVKRFDFLVGRGRHRDYKQDLLTEIVPVVSYHAVRQAVARLLYSAYEGVLGRQKNMSKMRGSRNSPHSRREHAVRRKS